MLYLVCIFKLRIRVCCIMYQLAKKSVYYSSNNIIASYKKCYKHTNIFYFFFIIKIKSSGHVCIFEKYQHTPVFNFRAVQKGKISFLSPLSSSLSPLLVNTISRTNFIISIMMITIIFTKFVCTIFIKLNVYA